MQCNGIVRIENACSCYYARTAIALCRCNKSLAQLMTISVIFQHILVLNLSIFGVLGIDSGARPLHKSTARECVRVV